VAEASLDAEAYARYPTLTEAEIKMPPPARKPRSPIWVRRRSGGSPAKPGWPAGPRYTRRPTPTNSSPT